MYKEFESVKLSIQQDIHPKKKKIQNQFEYQKILQLLQFQSSKFIHTSIFIQHTYLYSRPVPPCTYARCPKKVQVLCD